MISLSMNLLFGVPALAGPGRLKAGHHTDGPTQTGSWSQCMRKSEMGLSVNRSFVLVVLLVLVLDSVIWLRARARGRGRVGSWSQCMRKNERGLSMNLPSFRPAAE